MKKIPVLLLLVLAIVLLLSACGHEHAYGDWTVVKAATCTEDGVRERTCEKNDNTQRENIPATGHDFGDWEVVKEPSCEEEGTQERTCKTCGSKETKSIAVLGHSFGEWKEVKAVSCTENGEKERTCSLCGKKETESIPATGHDYEKATYVKPKTCKNCGATEGEALAKVVSIGSEVVSDDHSFTVSDVYFTSKVSESKGYTTYSSQDGNYCVIKLSFNNTSSESFDRWNSSRASDMTLIYADKFTYTGEVWMTQDIVPLDTQNLYIMYDVPAVMKGDESSSVNAIFGLDGEVYAISVREGDGSASSDAIVSADKNTERNISVGDTRSDGSSFEFSVSKVYYAKKVSEKHGNTTYNSQEGNYLIVELDFTNLSAEALEQWNTDRVSNMQLNYNNKFNYDGKCFVAENDIVPLETQKLYLMYDVVDTIKSDKDSPLIAVFTVDGSTFELDCQKNL